MPVEIGVWRIDAGLEAVPSAKLDFESRLEEILQKDISIASPSWMVIGRQVATDFDKRIDLLAIDVSGNLVVIELKRDRTYRDIVAQTLDYGSWVNTLRDDDIARIYDEYRQRHHPSDPDKSLDQAFCERFGVKAIPDELNASHELVIVAADLDPATERVVNYLSEVHQVGINAVFFRVFRDGEREYLTRAWLVEPTGTRSTGGGGGAKPNREWNGEYYCSFGGNRSWEDAVNYGYFSAGGGSWYSQTLQLLGPDDRIWVNVPGSGYVGVGIVKSEPMPIEEFTVSKEDGRQIPITNLPIGIPGYKRSDEDPEKAEYMVAVEWLATVPVEKAIKEKGFFGNQNSVARPKSEKWDYTVSRLKRRFGVDD